MSVSLSSFYQQTPALKALQQKVDKGLNQEQNISISINQIVAQAHEISMPQSYRLLAILAKHLKGSSSIFHKFAILLLSKQLFLTALHHFYIFGSIKIIPWVKNIANFQNRKNINERVRLYLQQTSFKGNGDQVIQERYCYKLLGFVDEFLPWFAANLPYHINALFQFSSTFKRNLTSISSSQNGVRFYQYFSDHDFQKFQKNFNILKCQSSLQLKQMCQFVGLELRTAIDQNKQKSQILKETVKTADSYCIRTIISQFTTLLEYPEKLICCINMMNYLLIQGEIELNQLIKVYCVPIIIQYIVPINFNQGCRLDKPYRRCSHQSQKLIIDSIYKWAKICELLDLSVALYKTIIKAMQQLQKPIFNIKKKHYSQFLTNVIDMNQSNKQKRSEIKNLQIQKQLISILDVISSETRTCKKIERHPVLWKSNISAINQLQDFKESRAHFGKKTDDKSIFWKSKVSQAQNLNTLSNNNFFKSQGIITSQNQSQNKNEAQNFPKQLHSGFHEQIYHQASSDQPKYVQVKRSNDCISSQSDRQQKNNRNQLPKSKKIERNVYGSESVQSYVPFQASKMSSFSQFQVKRSQENITINKNNLNTLKYSRQKSNSRSSKHKKLSSRSSKSESIIYFNNSHQFNSESRMKIYHNTKNNNNLKILQFNEPSNQNPSFSSQQYMIGGPFRPKQQKPSKILNSSSSSLSKSKSSTKNNNATIYFRNSINDNPIQSTSTSKITEYGVQGNDIPQSSKKPKFGFKKITNTNGRQSQTYQFTGSDAFNNFVSPGKGNHILNIDNDILSNHGSESQIPNKLNKGPKYLTSARVLMSSWNQVSDIQGNRNQNTHRLLNSDQNYHIMSRVKQKTENESSESQINDQMMRKYQLQQSRGINIKLPQTNVKNTIKKSKKMKSPNKFIIQQYQNDKLLQLERQVGRAKRMKQQRQRQLKYKQEQYMVIKEQADANLKNRQKIINLKKQNEILELLTLQKNQQQYAESNNLQGIVRPINNQIKIQDFFLKNQIKGLYSMYLQPFDRTFIKQLLGSRCLLIKNQMIELGYNYSHRVNQISLYLTLIKAYDQVQVKVYQNSLLLNQQVQINMSNLPAHNQLKIKRRVVGISQKKKDPTFSEIIHQNPLQVIVYPQIQISLNQLGQRPIEFSAKIPCSIFNLAQPLQITSKIIKQLKNKKVIKSSQMRLSDQFIRGSKQKVAKYFPHCVSLSQGWSLIGYDYKGQIFGDKNPDFLKFKIEGTKIQFEIFGDPKNPLIETLICIFVGHDKN